MTLYELLGITREATPQEIHAAYRTLAKTAHPDVGGDPKIFRAIDDAHEILMDQEMRERYDKTGDAVHPGADNKLAKMLEMASLAFNDVVKDVRANGERIEQVDVIQRMIGVIRRRQQELTSIISQAEEDIEFLKPLCARFASKATDGPNLLGEMLRGRQRIAQAFIEKTTGEIAHLDKTAEFVSGFTYRSDPVRIGGNLHQMNPWQAQALDFQAAIAGHNRSTTTTGRS